MGKDVSVFCSLGLGEVAANTPRGDSLSHSLSIRCPKLARFLFSVTVLWLWQGAPTPTILPTKQTATEYFPLG